MTQAIQKQRDSNLELFRIIVMLSIIAHHYVVNSGIWGVIQESEPSTNTLFYYLFGMWGKTGINCFVLITGWFMCTSQITLRKFLKLLLEIEFYKIIIGIIFILVGKETFSSDWLLGLLPVRNIKTGFVSCFLLFFLLIHFFKYPGQEYDATTAYAVDGSSFFSLYDSKHGSGIQCTYELCFLVLCPIYLCLLHEIVRFSIQGEQQDMARSFFTLHTGVHRFCHPDSI